MGREKLIHSVAATSLAWDDNSECAIDRVTAIAIASKHNEIGAVMLRVEALDAPSMRKAILLVVRELNRKHRITRGFAQRMAVSIMRECMEPQCPSCGGRRELYSDGEVVLVCTDCGGLGLRRYSDSDRRAMVGSGYNKAAYDSGLGYVRDSLRMIVSGADGVLE